METEDEAAINFSYDDFEPFCRWRREENCDLLEVHGLQDFKREQLNVRMKLGTLIITGELPRKNNIRSRFRKEIRIPKNCKIEEIRAKFKKRGILCISLPKKTSSASSKKGSNTRDEKKCLPSNFLAVAVVILSMAIAAFAYKYYLRAN
ncbi:hypothetical protein P3X46_008197 [Hevea brasiliensis]|uniref:SHSP domain-containing protein n=1 Tax=Hevea brasiliensis TaxID=3981 RepID=A0ABQ9MIZ1_HEVBR|nr:inactive protein RESTRICTED TEV MOVEMENT 2 [Hevea brasiliensis]KAJ9179883.1 hypothetical protein P3X46_008197 [Hevea brasiliensis]